MTAFESNQELNEKEKLVLNQIQTSFPVESRPYQVLGERLGMSEDDVLGIVQKLRKSGLIRRMGGNFAAKNLGYVSTLCAAKVPMDKFDLFVETVNKFSGVTHNYRRENDLNVWFTFIAPSMKKVEESLSKITAVTGVDEIYNLPADRLFKIKVDFQFKD